MVVKSGVDARHMQVRFAYTNNVQLLILPTTSLRPFLFSSNTIAPIERDRTRTKMAKNKQQQEKPTVSFDEMIKAGM